MEHGMNIEINTIRLLGAAQLFVFAASMLSERLLISAAGNGTISEKMTGISQNLKLARTSNLAALANCLGIIVLGVLFYVVFHTQYKTIALAALGFFVAEALVLAVSKLGIFSLIPLSQQFIAAGSPDNSFYQTLGDFLYSGLDRRGYDIHMLFFCCGAILWYYLLYVSMSIPRALSIWGLAAACLILIPTVLVLYDRKLEGFQILGLAYAPYELVLGFWLLIKGFV
jgi:hypothetical protein